MISEVIELWENDGLERLREYLLKVSRETFCWLISLVKLSKFED